MRLPAAEALGGPERVLPVESNMKPILSVVSASALALGVIACSARSHFSDREAEAPNGANSGNSDREAEASSVADSGDLVANALTAEEANTVLRLIDAVCGDTWCEGDFQFRFESIFCSRNAGNCLLVFLMSPIDLDPGQSAACRRSCATTGFAGFASLVRTEADGYAALQPSYYDALADCVTRLEGACRSF